MSEKVVPITLLTGYLGAGKTTLINHVLNNQKGYKVAVIVNDIGEVNIDADLIGKGGIVQEEDSSLVPLQNGCICCTLKVDLMQQIVDIINTKKLIEASGVCEPLPIAQTITVLSEQTEQYGLPKICRLDNVVTVVDSLRLRDEFNCGNNLVKENIEEEDIENLLIQQIEFCNKIILNKVDELSEDELNMVKAIVKKLQPKAEIIEANYSKVDVDKILDTNSFNFEEASMSAGWIEELNREDNEEENHEEHHHHDDDEDEEENGRSKIEFAPLAVFCIFFVAELGDKTQLTAITFGANEGMGAALIIWIGCSLGLFAADILGMLIGYLLKSKTPDGLLNTLAFVIFSIFGVYTLYQGLKLISSSVCRIPVLLILIAVVVVFAGLCAFLFVRRKKKKRKNTGNE